MLKKFFHYWLNRYVDARYEVKSKTKVFLVLNSIYMIFQAIVGLLIDLIINNNPLAFTIDCVMMGSVVVSLILLKTGKYIPAANLNILSLLVFLFLSVLFDPNATTALGISQLSLFLIGMLFYTCLVGFEKKQVLIVGGASTVVLILYYFYRILSDKAWSFDPVIFGSLVFAILLMGLMGLIAYLILSISKESISIMEKESAQNSQKAVRIAELFRSAKKGLMIGEKLTSSSEETLSFSQAVAKEFEEIRNAVDRLNQDIMNTSAVNSFIVHASRDVRKVIENHNAAVNETSAVVEEITASLNTILSTSQKKREIIDRLSLNTVQGEKEMNESIASINEIEKSISDITSVIRVILGVASKTNLLAMNAAIEAAHAGEYGKGFSVVAEEIKKLAEETNKNSKTVSNTLKTIVSNILKATQINDRAGKTFHVINGETKEVADAIGEIISGMSEISAGSKEITTSITDLITVSENINSSMIKVDEMIGSGTDSLMNIGEFTSELKSKFNDIVGKIEKIMSEMRIIQAVGRENVSQAALLNSEIEKLSGIDVQPGK